MRCLGKVGPFATAIIVWLGAGAEAGSIQLHHDRAKIEAADLRFYERQVMLRDLDPQKFDRVHPLGGRLLSSEAVYEKLLREWEEHPGRFEHDHECVWHVLDGDMIYHELHPYVPSVDLPFHSDQGSPPVSGGSGNHDDGGPGGGPGGGIHPASVPEPSSAALLVSALVVVLLAAACRRAYGFSVRDATAV